MNTKIIDPNKPEPAAPAPSKNKGLFKSDAGSLFYAFGDGRAITLHDGFGESFDGVIRNVEHYSEPIVAVTDKITIEFTP